MKSEKPLMAKALADAVGATRRQVQLWTDAHVIDCLPGTDRQGTGRKRLYDQSEIPFAALAAELAKWQISIGRIALLVGWVRASRKIRKPKMILRGTQINWLVIPRDQEDLVLMTERIGDSLKAYPSAIVINVKEVMEPQVREEFTAKWGRTEHLTASLSDLAGSQPAQKKKSSS